MGRLGPAEEDAGSEASELEFWSGGIGYIYLEEQRAEAEVLGAFFYYYSLLACDLSRSWRGYIQSVSCPLSAQWRLVASTPFALRPGLSRRCWVPGLRNNHCFSQRLHGVHRRGIGAGRGFFRFLFRLSFVVSLVRIISSRDRPGRGAKGGRLCADRGKTGRWWHMGGDCDGKLHIRIGLPGSRSPGAHKLYIRQHKCWKLCTAFAIL